MIPVIVEAFEQHDRWSVEAAPCIVVSDESGVLDTIALDAAALAFAWVDARTLVVLDKAGHVSFWRWS
jgi:hypothetical protein